MKKSSKSLMSFVLSMVLVLTGITVPVNTVWAEETTNSGECGADGDNLTWTLADGVLTISGEGAMKDCSSASSWPWYASRSSIKSVEIGDGVTSIGNRPFYEFKSLESIQIPASVTSIGDYAFQRCSKLSSIEIPASVTSIGRYAFCYCDNLSSVVILAEKVSCNGFLVFRFDSSDHSVKTIIYPAGDNDSLSNLGLSDVATQMSITEKEDGTVSLYVEKVSDNIANGEPLTLPTYIGGKTISSISYADEIPKDSISISHEKHNYNGYEQKDASEHVGVCTVCGEQNESHSFGDGTEVCACGYVPFTVSANCASYSLTYGSTKGKEISVSANTTLGTETLTYEWKLDSSTIDEATMINYVLPAGVKAGNHVYSCTVICNGYSQTVEIPVTVAKKQITVQADNKEKTEGEENPALTYSVPKGVLETGDTTADWTVNMNTTATKDSAAGTYEITGTATSENYEITIIPGTLTVKAAQTVNPQNPDASKDNTPGGNSGTSKDESQSGNPEESQTEAPKKGDEIKDANNKAVYKITKVGDTAGKVGTVQYVKPVKKSAKTVSIPSTITVDGIKYKVTSIASKAFEKNKYITKVTIGDNVKTIGSSAFYKCTKLKTVTIGKAVTTISSKAFYGCTKLKTLTIKSTKLKIKKIGSKAFTKTPKSMTVKVPKKKVKAYKTILLKKGVNKKAKFKKM